MQIIKTKNLSGKQFSQIDQLWNEEYPVKLKDRFPILLEGVENYHHFLIENKDHNVLAWAVAFEKDQEIRFSIIVQASQKGKGLGSLLIEKLKSELNEFYGWVIDHDNDVKSNGENYRSPMAFYLKHGFTVLSDQTIKTEMLSAIKIKWTAVS